MKKIVLLLSIVVSFSVFGQKLVKNEVDEFTGSLVQETNWTTLRTGECYMRIRKVDSTYLLGFKLITQKVVSVEAGENLMFKFENDEILKFNNLEYELSNYGAGATGLLGSKAQGINLVCSLSKEQLEKLQNNLIVKIRVYFRSGYRDYEVKKKHSLSFQGITHLFN